MRTTSDGGRHSYCDRAAKGIKLIKANRWSCSRALSAWAVVVLALLYVTPWAWGAGTCVTNGTPGLVRVSATFTKRPWTWNGCSAYGAVKDESSGSWSGTGDHFNDGEAGPYGTGWVSKQGGGEYHLFVKNSLGTMLWETTINFPSDASKQIDYALDIVFSREGSCHSALTAVTIDNGAAVVNPCAPACTTDAVRNGVPVTADILSFVGQKQIWQTVYTFWTRQRCVGGAWLTETNGWFLPDSQDKYIILKTCRDGQWQQRMRINGYGLSGPTNNLRAIMQFGAPENNPKGCGQLSAEKQGLVWTNLDAGLQAFYNSGFVGSTNGDFFVNSDHPVMSILTNMTGETYTAVGYSALDSGKLGFGTNEVGIAAYNSDGTNIVGALTGVSGGVGTGQGTGRVQNVGALGVGAVNIQNLADLAAAVAQGVRDAAGTNAVGDFSGPSLSGVGDGTATVYGAWSSVSNAIATATITTVLTGATQFASIGRLQTYSLPELSLGGSRKINLVIDFQSGMGVGITIFRTALLIGVVVVFWGVAMKTVREGIA